MHIAHAPAVRLSVLLAVILCLGSLPAAAQLSHYRAAVFTEGNLFFFGEANNDEFAFAVATGDFNGDGADDLATGVPFDDNLGGGFPRSGIVIIRYGVKGLGLAGGTANNVLSQAVSGSPDPAEEGDWFGRSLAAGDFNGDGYDDLAVGVPGERIHESPEEHQNGAVQIHYGSASGLALAGAQFLHENTPGVPGGPNWEDWMGWSLAAGDFNGDGRDDLAVGVPKEGSTGSDVDYGAALIFYGSASGLTTSGVQRFHQDLAGMDGSEENWDRFGWSLAAGDFDADGFDDLAVGVIQENNSGGVHIILGSAAGLAVAGNNLWTQDDPGMQDEDEEGDSFGDALAAADFNGDGFDDVAVGVPGEDLGTATDAGAVHIFFGSSSGISGLNSWMWTSSSSTSDASEAGDLWGRKLATGDFDADGYADLAIGAPGETLAAGAAVGQVTILRGHPDGITFSGRQLWHQDSPGVPGANEQGDEFGRSLAAGDFDGNGHADLVIGAPRESTSAFGNGAAWVLYGFVFGDGFESGGTSFWSQTVSSAPANSVQAAAAARLGPAASTSGLQVNLVNPSLQASVPTYVRVGPDRGFNNETALSGTFFINPQNLTVSPATGVNNFQVMTFLEGFSSNSLVRLIFNLTRNTADGDWFINVQHWNDNVGNWQFSGGGFFALDGNPSFANNRIDFEWTRGNPGQLTMWRTRYVNGAPDASGRIQMFSVPLPGMQNAAINHVFAGLFAGQDPGTFGTLYLDELSFSR